MIDVISNETLKKTPALLSMYQDAVITTSSFFVDKDCVEYYKVDPWTKECIVHERVDNRDTQINL